MKLRIVLATVLLDLLWLGVVAARAACPGAPSVVVPPPTTAGVWYRTAPGMALALVPQQALRAPGPIACVAFPGFNDTGATGTIALRATWAGGSAVSSRSSVATWPTTAAGALAAYRDVTFTPPIAPVGDVTLALVPEGLLTGTPRWVAVDGAAYEGATYQARHFGETKPHDLVLRVVPPVVTPVVSATPVRTATASVPTSHATAILTDFRARVTYRRYARPAEILLDGHVLAPDVALLEPLCATTVADAACADVTIIGAPGATKTVTMRFAGSSVLSNPITVTLPVTAPVATVTPVPTRTSTPTLTVTPTASATRTPTPTMTATRTSTPTRTATPVPTRTATPSPQPTTNLPPAPSLLDVQLQRTDGSVRTYRQVVP